MPRAPLMGCRMMMTPGRLQAGGQAVGLHHLEIVELDEQGDEASDHDEADPADLAVHRLTPVCFGGGR